MTIQQLLKNLVAKEDLNAAIVDIIAYAYAIKASLKDVAKSGKAEDLDLDAITGLVATDAQAAIEELLTKIGNADITVEQTNQNLASGILQQTVIKKGGTAIATINLPKDYLDQIVGLAVITAGTGADEGKFFDGATEVTSAQGVTAAGTYLKVNQAAKGDTADYRYANMAGLIEYVTSGSQSGDMVVIAIDPITHQVTATISDGTITEAKLVSAVQTKLSHAESAYGWGDHSQVGYLTTADFATIGVSEAQSLVAAAITAAETPAAGE